MTSSLNKWNDKDPPKSSGDVFGEVYKQEINILNQNFLSSIQNELKNSPDACLAPLVMEYLHFLYPLVKTTDAKVPENDPATNGVKFLEVAKFFSDMKDNLENEDSEVKPETESSSSSSNGPTGDLKPIVLPTSKEPELEKAPIAGPGFFGLLGAKPASAETETKPTLPKIEEPEPPKSVASTSSLSSQPSAAPFKSFSFGLNANPLPPASNNFSGESAFSNSLLNKQSTSASSATSTPTTFSFTGFGSVPKINTTISGGGISGTGTSFFGGSMASTGFTQSSFGSGMLNPAASLGSGVAQTNVNGTSEDKDDSDEDDSPPKPDFVPVVESDSLYTQKIKLYEMQGKAYKDLGYGNLFIKELPGPKFQLVVRADNSLGTILVNAVLNSSIPVRQNKPINILVTVPNSEGKPSTFLFRVKEDSIGNELLKILEKYKNS